MTVILGSPTKLPFTACDADALPVSHRLPRAQVGDLQADPREFTATMTRLAGEAYSGYEPELFVFYANAGRYYVLVDVEAGLGEHVVSVSLDGESLLEPLTVNVVCPRGLVALAGNVSCGCEAGSYPAELGSEIPCLPCEVGTAKEDAGDDSCVPCRVGTFMGARGAQECLPCAPGSYAGGSGATSCDACGPGTSSDVHMHVEKRRGSRALVPSRGNCPHPRRGGGDCVHARSWRRV